MMSPPVQAGTGVPSGLPVVVFGEGRGSYCRVKSQYWPGSQLSALTQSRPERRTVRPVALIRPEAMNPPALLGQDRPRGLVARVLLR